MIFIYLNEKKLKRLIKNLLRSHFFAVHNKCLLLLSLRGRFNGNGGKQERERKKKRTQIEDIVQTEVHSYKIF